jgi:hypothetical protein
VASGNPGNHTSEFAKETNTEMNVVNKKNLEGTIQSKRLSFCSSAHMALEGPANPN